MLKKIITTLLILIAINVYSQQKPKIVIGIVVDQMRYDFIDRFWDDFREDGFKKLVNSGHFCRNTNFGYMPTFTGPGHASIFTGTTPSTHGIIANNWFDKESEKLIYCAGDGEMHTVCNCEDHLQDVGSSEGKMSPHNMLTTTIGDEIKLFNPNSKVIGISLKDRGAILSAGHSADAAYWMNNDGEWITSSYYMQKLPEWLTEYQQKSNVLDYLKDNWFVKNRFNHNLDSLMLLKGGGIIKSTPSGNTILKDLAIEIIKKEKLGQGKATDMLTISFSSTDYIGHQYGPHSDEIRDTYIKLDKDIAELLRVIESKIGYENVLLFLTADHGVVSEPSELIKRNIPAGYYDKSVVKQDLNNFLQDKYNWPSNNPANNYVLNFSNNQIFLNHEFINNVSVDIKEVRQACADFLLKYSWVKNTFTADQLHYNEYLNPPISLVQKGYNQKRSGDIMILPHSGWISISWRSGGTTHGSCFSYDTHIPLIFWGGNIKKGKIDRPIYIRDIAPTISLILGVSYPNGCTGDPIFEITE
tara:strand:+ start:2942 stop:4525 length:1584 start_codon:yes stop_codon:yes gene_type:complete